MKNKSLNLKTKELMKRAVSFITAVAMVITILPLQPITAYAEETPEVLWGTSADSLTNSGTWEQLYNILNTEKENTSINYVKANKSDALVLYDLPVYKELTVDIAGHNLRLTSGGFISAKVPGVTVTVLDTAENDGTLMGNCTRIIFIEGTLNLEGGKFENNFADGAVITSGGASTCVDISRHPDPEGITINYLMAELSEEAFKNQFKLPQGYAWFGSENNAVTAMKPYNIYTVGKSSEGITYNVTVNYIIGGGDVTAQPSSATEGTAVNITVNPYYNRELVSLKVKQGNTEIPVTDNQFIMPAGDVVIYPEFRVINPTIEVTAADGTVTLTDVFWQAMAAVENSTSLETTVKLLDNITIPSRDHDVSKGVFTFNLNGKTINGGGDEAALDFGADTKVVITGNGTVENAVNAIKTASDSLTIDNGNFTGTKNAINICGGNTTINSGTFTVDYNSGSETAVNLTGGKAVINGGNFTSVSVALNIEYSEAEVNGGTFTAPNAISIYIDGKLSISGNASIDGEYFDINNSSFGTPVIITSEIDANAPISLITGYAGSPLAKGADGITLNPDWFASADPGKIIYYNQTDNTIYLKKCTHSWSEDNTCAICGITGYGVYIKGIHINELNAEDVLGDGTVNYNAQTATLTLSGADISNSDNSHSLEIDKGDITLVLIGENSLGAGDENHFAVWIENGASLTVSENSTGSLTAPTGLKATENYGYLLQEKIYVNRSITGGGDFTVKGGTVSGSIFMGGDIAITGGTVNADYLAAENVTISGGSVTADGKANIEYYDINAPYGTYGIYADNNILISGGTVTASGGYASVNESALKLNSISKATATAAMYAGNVIDITGGTVTATGGQWNNFVPDPLGFMKLGSYTETPSDFAKPDTVIDLYGKALKAQSFTISDNAVFICGSDTTHDMQYCAGDAENTIAYKCVFCGKNAENVTATVNAEDAVYNGSAYDKASVVYGDSWNSSKNLVITYTGTTFGGEYYNSTTAPSAAGEYTAFVTLNDITVSDKFEISRAEPSADMFTVTYPSNLVYDGNAKTVTAAVKVGFTGVGDILVKYYDENGDLVTEAVNAGKYTVKLSVSEGENYLAAQEPIFPTDGASWKFEITKATYDMSNVKWNRTTGEPFEFDGNTHTVELTGLPQGVTASYTENSKTPVGTYIAKAELNYDSENYNTPDAIPSLEWYIEWNTAENKDYTINSAGTPNSDGWYNSQIHIIPADDYIFYTNNDALEEDLITLNEDTADGSVTFRVYDPETLSMSYGKTVTYKLDTTAPTGTVSVEENSCTAFLNSITFNKFFNKTVDVKVEAADITSGVKSVEYIESSEALTQSAVEQRTDWTDMGADRKVSVTAEDAKQFVYYIRITDNADNMTIISSNGMVFDLKAPEISIENGKTYYTTQKFTVTEANLADVKVNDATVTDYTLAGNVDATNKVVVTDKAGNITTVTVTMRTIASISESIKDLTESSVTGDNADIIKEAEETLAAVDTTYATDAEKAEIAAAQANVDALQEVIEETEKEVSDIEAEAGALNPDTVTSDDKAEVEQFIGEMTDKLDDANLTDEQKDRIQQSIDEAKEILDKIAEDQENLNDALDSVPDVDTDNVTDGDIDNLQTVKENLEELLADENYTAEEKAEIQDKLDEIKDIANDIGKTYEIIHGAGGNWTKGSSKTLGFTADGLFKLFREVRVDGNAITRDVDYTAQNGSTIVTLNKSFLDTLSVGKHKLEVVYDVLGTEHIAYCEFTVKAKPVESTPDTTATPTDNVPKTGDTTNTLGWMAVMLSSMAAFAVVLKKKKEYEDK